ncbi:MAG: LytR C-terminal domain-containing protein [Flaviflexus sp.]|nr:LytR C-terminal domain-containing protein [Flaviflexus sp.]
MELPEDEFSELARERKLQGGHRKRRSPLRAALPLLLVLVVAPALAWATIELYSNDLLPLSQSSEQTATEDPTDTEQESPSAEPTASAEPSQSAEPTTEPSSSPTEEGEAEPEESGDGGEPSESPSESPSEETGADVAYDAVITVLNGSGRTGHAAQTASQLNGVGYSNTTTGNYGRALPTETTVYFSGPEMYSTAQNIAANLGVNLFVESASATGNADIVIVLR